MRRTAVLAVSIALATILLVVGIKSALGSGEPTPDRSSEAEPARTTQPTPTAKQDPVSLVSEKRSIKEVSRRFIELYYSRDREMLELSSVERTELFQRRLRPYVTARFLSAEADPVDTPADDALRDSGRTVSAVVQQFGGMHIEDSDSAEVDAELLRKITDGNDGYQDLASSATIYLELDGQKWRVQAVEESFG